MGVYLYGLKKLKKSQRVVRSDGAVAVVTHFLNYRCKPYWSMASDPTEQRILGELAHRYGDRWQGFVLYGDCIVAWDGPPHWYDGGDFPKGSVVWGEALDRHVASREDRDEGRTTLSRARLPSMRVKDDEGRMLLLERALQVLDSERYVVDSIEVYGCRRDDLGEGTVEFGGGPKAIHLKADNDRQLLLLWSNYCLLANDWLQEKTVLPPPKPKAAPPPPPPAPTHEELLRAAGWLG